jgi:hypothetical protein
LRFNLPFLGMLVSACAHMLVSAQGSPECYLFGGMAYLLVDSLELVTAYVLGRIYQCTGWINMGVLCTGDKKWMTYSACVD